MCLAAQRRNPEVCFADTDVEKILQPIRGTRKAFILWEATLLVPGSVLCWVRAITLKITPPSSVPASCLVAQEEFPWRKSHGFIIIAVPWSFYLGGEAVSLCMSSSACGWWDNVLNQCFPWCLELYLPLSKPNEGCDHFVPVNSAFVAFLPQVPHCRSKSGPITVLVGGNSQANTLH